MDGAMVYVHGRKGTFMSTIDTYKFKVLQSSPNQIRSNISAFSEIFLSGWGSNRTGYIQRSGGEVPHTLIIKNQMSAKDPS